MPRWSSFPDDDAKWMVRSRYVGSARPDTSGCFESTGLPRNGDYRIIAVKDLESGFAADPDVPATCANARTARR